MPTTPILGLRSPSVNDPPNVPADIKNLADDVEATLAVLIAAPAGDGSHSQILTAGHIAVAASTRTDILSTTFTLDRAQNVLISARARGDNQSASQNPGIGFSILVDTVVQDLGQAGPVVLATQGGAYDQVNVVIPTFAVALAAGSHTVKLQADRDTTAATVWVMESATMNGRVHRPTALSVII